MSTLLQISDTHFGTEQIPVVNALRQLNHELQPSVVVLSGDITQRARRSQFAAARRFVAELNAPHMLIIPGNHDIPLNPVARLFHAYANYEREFGNQLEPQLELPSVMVICVNTTRAYRHTEGEVSARQVEQVAQTLRRATPLQLRIVVVHQPVHVIDASDVENLLHGHEKAVRAWATAGADIVMGGHIHLPYVRPMSDRFADLDRRVWAVQAGTALSSRVREDIPNSVNVLHHAADGSHVCRVERWDFDSASQLFRLHLAHELQLDRAG